MSEAVVDPVRREQVNRCLHGGLIDLASCIGEPTPEFSNLQATPYLFDAATHFVLSRVVAGDEDAADARDCRLRAERMAWGLQPYRVEPDGWSSYLQRNMAAYRDHRRTNFPWELGAVAVEGAEGRELDAVLDEVVVTCLKPFGFDPTKHRRRAAHWECTSRTLPVELTLRVDKGSRPHTDLGVFLTIPKWGHLESVSYPFFFSGAAFVAAPVGKCRAQLLRFFDAYACVFPRIVACLERAIRQASDPD